MGEYVIHREQDGYSLYLDGEEVVANQQNVSDLFEIITTRTNNQNAINSDHVAYEDCQNAKLSIQKYNDIRRSVID